MKSQIIAPKPLTEVTSEEWARVSAGLKVYVKLRLSYVQKYGLSLDDIVQETLLLTLLGKRRWPVVDPETGATKRNVDLLTFLSGVARSVASHVIEKERRNVSFTDLLNDEGQECVYSDHRLLVDHKSELRTGAERNIAQDEYESALLSVTRAHPRLMRRARLMMRRRKVKVSEVARFLGVDIKRARYLMNLLNGGNCNGKKEDE
jgi:DNA-directed RNA polymerase specialized sigma24 family protein